MGSCDEILDWISAALDDQLNAEEQAALEEHLAHCPACSALYDDLRTLHAATADMEEIPAPAGFSGAVMAAIAADPAQEQADNTIPFARPKKARTPWTRWVASAAAVAIIVAGVSLRPNFAHKSSSNFDSAADMADYNLSESVTMDSSAQESVSENSMSAACDLAKGQAQTDTYNGAAEDTVKDSEPASHPELTEKADSAPQPSGAYCGVLTLSSASLPEGLNKFKAVEDSQGNLTYVVSPEYFFSALDAINAESDQAPLALDLEDADADAEYGLIIVERPS